MRILQDRQAQAPFLSWYGEYPGQPDQARLVRGKIRQLLPPGPFLDDALCVGAEIVANAIEHTNSGQDGLFGVELEWRPGRVRLIVSDQGSSDVPQVQEVDDTPESGNGLNIVDALSLGWGCFGGREGHAVWADEPSADTLSPQPHLAGWTPTELLLTQLGTDFPGVKFWYEDDNPDLDDSWWAVWDTERGDEEYVFTPSLRCMRSVLTAWYPGVCPDNWYEAVACGPRRRLAAVRSAAGQRPTSSRVYSTI